LAAARLKGRIGGKPKGLTEDAKNTARIAESLYKEGYAVKLISEKLKVSRPTIYNYLKYRGVF
ncbi:resolvase, partial [Nostoc linckia z16]